MVTQSEVAMLKRIELLEVTARTHSESISAIVNDGMETKKRIGELEDESYASAISKAREDERDKALYARLDSLEAMVDKRVGAIEGVGSKALWVFSSAILLGFAAFMLKGGLTL